MTVVSTFKGSAHKYAVIGVRGEESLAISLVVYPENDVLFLDARFVAFHAYDTKVETMVFNHLKPRQLTQMVIDGTPKIIVRLNHFLIKLFTPAPSRYYLGALCADLAVWDLLASHVAESMANEGFTLIEFEQGLASVLRENVFGENKSVSFDFHWPSFGLSEGAQKVVAGGLKLSAGHGEAQAGYGGESESDFEGADNEL
jgi:hypothetical protein